MWLVQQLLNRNHFQRDWFVFSLNFYFLKNFVNGEQISQLQTNMYYNIVCIFNMFSLLLAYAERKWRKPFSYKCIINSLNLSGQLQVFSRFFGTSFLPCHLYCIVLKKWMSLFINTAGTWQLICITGSYLMDLYDEIGALLFYLKCLFFLNCWI